MSGEIRIVAILSERFSIVLVLIIAGTAQAADERRGINDLPDNPNLPMNLSMINDTRERYPDSSMIPMNKNKSAI